jgi:hypothetical protein
VSTPYAGLSPVQAAIYDVLVADEDLSDMVVGVFDGEAPEGTPRPYILIGDALEVPDNAHGVFGRQTVTTLHVWSDYRGWREANRIADAVIGLLDHRPLVVPGWRHVVTRFEFVQTLMDPDRPDLRHTPVRFRVVTYREQ